MTLCWSISPTPAAQDVGILDELLHWAHVAEAAYGKDGTEVSLVSGIATGSISACELLPDVLTHRPAYVLALDGSRQAIVVSIRGTADLLDIITDISAGPTQLDGHPDGHWAHEGISRAAKQVFEEVRAWFLNHNRCPSWISGGGGGGGDVSEVVDGVIVRCTERFGALGNSSQPFGLWL